MRTLFILTCSILAASCSAPGTGAKAFVGATIFDGERTHESSVLVVRDGVVEAVADEAPAGAEVIDVSQMSGDTIKFGATVTLVDEDTDEEKHYQIVGDQEADVNSGKISISSPISRALIGKEEGDSVEVAAPGGARSYEVLKIQYV